MTERDESHTSHTRLTAELRAYEEGRRVGRGEGTASTAHRLEERAIRLAREYMLSAESVDPDLDPVRRSSQILLAGSIREAFVRLFGPSSDLFDSGTFRAACRTRSPSVPPK